MRSKKLAALESDFKSIYAKYDQESYIAATVGQLQDLVSNLFEIDSGTQFGVAVCGARLGVLGDGEINDKERILIDSTLGIVYKGPKEELYEMIGKSIGNSDYELAEKIVKHDVDAAYELLLYILCFAYVDGKFEDDIAEKIDGIFSHTLLFSGSEEEEADEIFELQTEIIMWLQNDKCRKTLKEIQTHFSDYSETDVEMALDMLCKKGILRIEDKYNGRYDGNLYINPYNESEKCVEAESELERLQLEIVNWLRADNKLRPLTDFQEHFSDIPKATVKEALDGLCSMGILYGGDNFVCCLYGLA